MIDAHITLPSQPKVVGEDGFRGTYEIEGLYPGYGYTLGNSLRRIILSSLQGSAITSLKIDGISHEFSTIPGVKEDVIMLILNLKKVRFKMLTDEPQRLQLNVKGIKEVTAKDLETGGQVEVLNPEVHLATLTEKGAELTVEITLEKGLGYLSKEALRKDRNEIGLIFVDAPFTPINRVSYEVENMRVGDRTDFNRLRLQIETDGTLSPHEALARSIEIMIAQLQAVVGFKAEAISSEVSETAPNSGEGEVASGDKTDRDEALKTRVEDLNVSPRAIKALVAAGIRTVGGLARKKEEDLAEVEGLGDKAIAEIKEALSNLGISLK